MIKRILDSVDKKIRPAFLLVDERAVMSFITIACIVGLLGVIL